MATHSVPEQCEYQREITTNNVPPIIRQLINRNLFYLVRYTVYVKTAIDVTLM